MIWANNHHSSTRIHGTGIFNLRIYYKKNQQTSFIGKLYQTSIPVLKGNFLSHKMSNSPFCFFGGVKKPLDDLPRMDGWMLPHLPCRPLPRRRLGVVFPPVLDAKDAATGLPPPAPLGGFAVDFLPWEFPWLLDRDPGFLIKITGDNNKKPWKIIYFEPLLLSIRSIKTGFFEAIHSRNQQPGDIWETKKIIGILSIESWLFDKRSFCWFGLIPT